MLVGDLTLDRIVRESVVPNLDCAPSSLDLLGAELELADMERRNFRLRDSLDDLFDEDVSHQDLIDALEQMHQPRDAFKFVYQIISEHCSNVPQDHAIWRIPRLTLDNVRRQQSQRVQDLSRWLAPA